MGPVVYMALDQAVRGRARHGPRVRPRRAVPLLRPPRPRVGDLGDDDQSIAGLIMAVEQSLVMGIALVVLFMRALASPSARSSAASATNSPDGVSALG